VIWKHTTGARRFGRQEAARGSPSRRSAMVAARCGLPAPARHLLLGRAVMHFLAFQFKRAHHTALRISLPLAAKFGLTPARFDMLYAIRIERRLSQAKLARALGVSGVTVSRMLRRLETLGLVRRLPRQWPDRRTRSPRLTRLGRRRLFQMLDLLKSRLLQRTFMRASQWHSLSHDAFMAVDDLHSSIYSMVKSLGDRAALHFPTWHPDD
jgi:DNA-binding MarR family transcriptional regulator